MLLIVALLQLDKGDRRLGQHLDPFRRIRKSKQRVEGLRCVVVLLAANLSQAEAGQHIGIVRRLLQELAVDAIGVFVSLQIAERLGEVILRARVFRIDDQERREPRARLLGHAGAEVEEGLLPLEIEIGRIVVDQRLQDLGGFLPLVGALINLDELLDGQAEGRIDFDGPLQILERFGTAAELCQHLRIAVVETTLIGSALEHRREHLLRLGGTSAREINLRDGHAGGEVVGIDAEGVLEMNERFVDLGPIVPGAIEEHTAEDALGVIEVRLESDHFAQLGFGGVDLRSIDENQRPLVKNDGVAWVLRHDFVDAQERFIEAAVVGGELGENELVGVVRGFLSTSSNTERQERQQ